MNLNQVSIPSHDLSVAAPFYQKLGLKLIVDAQPRYVRFECPDGDSTFSIHLVEESINTSGVAIYFECEDLDERVVKLKQKGVAFISGPQDETWLWREARLHDPDGNMLILYYAGKNRKNPPWRVG